MVIRSLTIQQHMSQECPTEVNRAVLENFGEILTFACTCPTKQIILSPLLTPKIKTKTNLFLSRFIFMRVTHARSE